MSDQHPSKDDDTAEDNRVSFFYRGTSRGFARYPPGAPVFQFSACDNPVKVRGLTTKEIEEFTMVVDQHRSRRVRQ